MKNCELCNGLARIYCESDLANLCWDCDLKVHSANFLVAKHSRSLLCHVCQSHTAWSASGTKVGRTVSTCDRCANDERTGSEDDDEDEDDVEEEENEDKDEEEIDLEDIQVVPWSSTPPPPPPPASSSSSDESLNSYGNFHLKRMREDDDDSGTSTLVGAPPPTEEHGGGEASSSVKSISTMRTPQKIQRIEESLAGRVETT